MAQHLSLRSGNPTLNENVFRGERALPGVEIMTISGTVNKTALGLLIVFLQKSTPALADPSRALPLGPF
jgi:hypothetical protein